MRNELIRLPEFRAYLVANTLERFAASGMTVLLGFQIYALTKNPLDLGWLGLVEAIPGIGLVLYGGHVADIFSRRRIVVTTIACLALLALVLASATAASPNGVNLLIYIVGFFSAALRAFETPAATGLEAQVLPLGKIMQGVPLISACARTADVVGPAACGFAWAIVGPAATYALLGLILATAGLTIFFGVAEKPRVETPRHEMGAARRIREGIVYVFGNQVLVGSMALDLFAVFFGGATALLPAIASDILHVGPTGFGLLRSAAAAGALSAAVIATQRPPRKNAGLLLHWIIAGFGVSIIVFGLSQTFWLSLVALFFSGVCDGLSMVIRHSIMRLASPETMRGRISAVRQVFVGSSNELGALESGFAASLLGTAPAVWVGGVITIVVVGLVVARAPQLRALDLEALAARGPDAPRTIPTARAAE